MKAIKVTPDEVEFEGGIKLYSNHDQDCCETHYLSFEHLSISDFEGLEFDLSNDNFFKKIEAYGIELIPVKGHPVRVPGYGFNNGYYGTNLDLIITGVGFKREYDISDCQLISE